MRSGVVKAIWVVAALVAVVAPRRSEAAIGCGVVVNYLSPCLPYVTNRGPLGRCCNGVMQLSRAAVNTQDRQAVCKCLKMLAAGGYSINYGKAASLPRMCGVYVPYPISPKTDCSIVR